jgi:hypothetical protein
VDPHEKETILAALTAVRFRIYPLRGNSLAASKSDLTMMVIRRLIADVQHCRGIGFCDVGSATPARVLGGRSRLIHAGASLVGVAAVTVAVIVLIVRGG